ncbi:hypothetical protein [Agathobaculum butyriciproducens]|uniref:hypothetical protein n=1 Tax=Agathobaculum butyriciproducens TaxID=1628085 RepID=UPI0036D27CCC
MFAFIGAAYLKRNPDIINRPVASTVFNFIIALLHAAAEMIIVTPFFISGALFTAEQLANGFVASVVLLVGLGTVIHSMLTTLFPSWFGSRCALQRRSCVPRRIKSLKRKTAEISAVFFVLTSPRSRPIQRQ